jgi:hypothetical protein
VITSSATDDPLGVLKPSFSISFIRRLKLVASCSATGPLPKANCLLLFVSRLLASLNAV